MTGACVYDPAELDGASSALSGQEERLTKGSGPGLAPKQIDIDDTDPDPCPLNGCGSNSPVIDGVYFGQLHLGGEANEEGVQITGAWDRYGTPMQLRLVEGDRLQGVDEGGDVIAEGSGLGGARIGLSVDGEPYELRIRGVDTEAFWARPPGGDGPVISGGAIVPIESYSILYYPIHAPDRTKPLCSQALTSPGMLTALVFGGDLYDPVTKEIEVGPSTDGWFNIACRGGAVYKMHKIGYTSAAQARLGIQTTVAQRRAMLNAWTSNVCGTGQAFTREGEPITLSESLGVLPGDSPYLVPAKSHEAIWNEHGAVCLDVHRRADEDPKIYGKLLDVCTDPVTKEPQLPPPCTDRLDDWTAHGHVLTGNPL